MALAKRLQSDRQLGVRGGKAFGVDVLGVEQLLRQFGNLRTTASRRIMTAGSAKAAQKLAKLVKAEVPSRHKTIRKSIGWRRLKMKEAPDGGAKVGGRVGRSSKTTVSGRDTSRKGVGISAQNIHWWFAGTAERQTGKRGGPVRSTGSMPPQTRPVHVIARRNKSELVGLWQQGAQKQLATEVSEGKAFA